MTAIRAWAASDRIAGPENAARRTVAGLVASALAVLPLREIFTDWAWLPNVWVAMLLTIGPAALLRTRQPARIIHLLPGLVLAVFYLTARFVPDHAWGGFVPLAGAWKDVAVLNGAFHTTVRDGAAPLHSTEAVRMVLAALLVLVAVAVDLVAVVARRPALAGVAFLAVYTVAGTVSRHAVGWLWFVLAALGYLLLLSSDTRDEVSRWGRLMPHQTGASRAAVKALTGRRIALIAIVIALAAPLLLPVPKTNLLADAFHGGSGGGGGEGGVSLDPFVRLKGQLTRKDPIDLLDVTTSGLGQQRPLYLSEYVLDTYDASGWHRGPRGVTEPLESTSFGTEPILPKQPASFPFTATINIKNLDDSAAPVFQSPESITGLEAQNWTWSRQDGALLGGRISKGQTYDERVRQPQPSILALQQSESLAKNADLRDWLQYPVMPDEVGKDVRKAVGGATSPYAKTKAILNFFLKPDSGFTYSLTTKTGDSGSALVDFLTNKEGFCQQYAGAMAIMLRVAGVPSRVVVGYTHKAPDQDGKFTVTTNDAHAWVEAYFAGVGWLPFDPTPLSGPDALRAAQMPWAPRPQASAGGAVASGGSGTLPASGRRTSLDSDAGTAPRTSGSSGLPAWVGWLLVGIAGLVVVLLLLPGSARLARRRARLHAAQREPDALWQELADTAVDLGYVWSPVRSPRQVVIWLRREGVSAEADESLRTLATAVELSRYANRDAVATRELVTDLRRVEVSLRETRSGWERARARLVPQSLGWLRRRRRH